MRNVLSNALDDRENAFLAHTGLPKPTNWRIAVGYMDLMEATEYR
jgi:hypothetical protein